MFTEIPSLFLEAMKFRYKPFMRFNNHFLTCKVRYRSVVFKMNFNPFFETTKRYHNFLFQNRSTSAITIIRKN